MWIEIISLLLFFLQKDEGHGTKTLKQLAMKFYRRTLWFKTELGCFHVDNTLRLFIDFGLTSWAFKWHWCMDERKNMKHLEGWKMTHP
jgi:hypothetical protein